jgi:hypothetical protein
MKKAAATIGFSFLVCLAVQAQSTGGKYDKLSKVVADEISREMPDWVCKAFEPSKDVLIQHWSLGEIGVKISVVEYDSPTTAAQFLNDHRSSLKLQEQAALRNRRQEIHLLKEPLNLGDEGFVRDNIGSEAVAFRKGAFLINVSVFSPRNSKDVYFSRTFAALVAAALNSKSE